MSHRAIRSHETGGPEVMRLEDVTVPPGGYADRRNLAHSWGCDHPIVYTREDFVARTRELTDGDGVHVVYDSVGKETFEGSLACLRPRGMLVGFGNASGTPPLFEVVRSGAVKVAVNQRFALADAADAHRALESRATTGSTVLIP